MTESLLFLLALVLPVVGIIVIPLLPHSIRAKTTFLFVVLVAAVTSVPAVKALLGNTVDIVIGQTLVFGNIAFHVDSLSSWFILITNLTCINGAFYGIGYMRQYDQQKANLCLHWMLFLLFQSSMLWVCMVQNGLAFLIVWELMSISSFLLVLFEHQNKRTLQAGINYLVQMHVGVLFLSAAFIWVYISEGSFEFSAIELFFSSHENLWLFLLFLVGFGIKAGFVPLHSWLPQAHPAAPSHISGIMSGVIVKMGIYGIFRMLFLLKQDYMLIGEIIIIISVLTGLYGLLNAAVHRDFKKVLAYCTIENVGIIGIGIGLGLIGIGIGNPVMIILGFAGALLHTLNHSLYKSLLFFTAGSVYQETHTRDMEKLGGLIHQMPHSAVFFLLGGMAISGLPPFNGFVSEFLLYSGTLIGIKSVGISYMSLMIFSLAGMAFMGGISILTFTKCFGTIFLGVPRTQLDKQPTEVGFGMRLPQYFILLIMISIGLFPQLYFSVGSDVIFKSLPDILVENTAIHTSFIHNIAVVGKSGMLFLLVLMFISFLKWIISRKSLRTVSPTWGCGYGAPSARMQYTGKSFSKSLGKLLNFVLLEKKKFKEIDAHEIFPVERKYASHYNDFFATKFFNVIVDRLLYSLNYFQFIQNGKLQMYVLYGVFFIVVVFVWTIFNFI